jgi:hypothetical protein
MLKLHRLAKQIFESSEDSYRGLIGRFDDSQDVDNYDVKFWSSWAKTLRLDDDDLALVLNTETNTNYLVNVDMITNEYFSTDFVGTTEYGWDEDGRTSTTIYHPDGDEDLEEEGILYFTKHLTEDGDLTEDVSEFKEGHKEILKITAKNKTSVIKAFKSFFITYSDRN